VLSRETAERKKMNETLKKKSHTTSQQLSSASVDSSSPSQPQPSSQNRNLITQLMRLALTTDYDQLAHLLSNISSSNLFAKDSKGRTALDWARMKNNSQAIALISEAMARELNQTRIEQSGMIHLSSEQHLIQTNRKYTKLLFELLKPSQSQSQPESQTESQRSESLTASSSRQEQILSLLFTASTTSQLSRDLLTTSLPNEIYFLDSIDPNTGDTPLLLAAGSGYYDVVIELLALGVNINQSNKYGHTPLTWCCVCGHLNIVRTLLLQNANYFHITKEKRTCLHYACLYLKVRVVSVIMDVLFEKFSMFRMISHPFTKYDPLRWRKYAEVLENFLMVRTPPPSPLHTHPAFLCLSSLLTPLHFSSLCLSLCLSVSVSLCLSLCLCVSLS
jgi:hypothetical protein